MQGFITCFGLSDNTVFKSMKRISVVVTAYNRKEFLPDSLNSLIAQTISKSDFEVVLLTNFDYDISPFGALNINHIILEGTIGEYLYEAGERAQGEIICFLDDDDIFDKNKLQTILKRFTENVIYLKHPTYRFKEIGELESLNLLPNDKIKYITKEDYFHPNIYAYNKSSISLRKSFFKKYSPFIKNIDTSEDWFLFLAFLSESGIGIYDYNFLSYYRVHQSASKKAISRSDSTFSYYVRFLHRQIRAFQYMKELFKNSLAQTVLDYQISVFKFRLLLLSGEDKMKVEKVDLMNLFRASAHNYNEFWIVKTLFVRSFIVYYFPQLSSITERVYAKISKRLNAQ